MNEKRFTNIEHDYENAWIKCNDNGDFMIYAIYKELDESLPSLEDLLNGLAEENKELKQQMNRLYNYFMDWHSDEMGGNQFSEMWDMVKESERWDENVDVE